MYREFLNFKALIPLPPNPADKHAIRGSGWVRNVKSEQNLH